jgi:hypothetical protein
MIISPSPSHPFGIPVCDLNHKVAVWQRYALNGTDVVGQPATASLDTTEIRNCIARASNAKIARRRLPTGRISVRRILKERILFEPFVDGISKDLDRTMRGH